MNIIEEMARYGTPEQKLAAAELSRYRGPPVTVFERIHNELCDSDSELSKQVDAALAEQSLAYSACANRLF